MKKLSCLILLVLFSNTVSISAQQNAAVNTSNDPPASFQIMRKGIAENNYLTPLLELKEREAEYL